MKFFVIEEDALVLVERVKKRLFTENRMGGDDMRDAAQMLDAFIRQGFSCEDVECGD
jgi:hypothetical protein